MPNARIMKMTTLLKVRGIGASKHKTDKYMLELFYLFIKNNNKKWFMVCICQKLHIVKNLRINFLIKNNIIDAKSIKINIGNKKTYIPGYKTIVLVTAKQKN